MTWGQTILSNQWKTIDKNKQKEKHVRPSEYLK